MLRILACQRFVWNLHGVILDVPGLVEQVKYIYTQVNLERLLKYVVIQSYRYRSYAEHNERIYDIRLSFAYSSFTVFHDSCNDMYEFNKDLTFPYGAPSEGVLEVPSGQSYMKWTSIVTGTNWHGPQYVHVLDRPFRLYQLSDFSVVGQLVQSSSTMGNAYVGLFDENKQCVMAVNWGDAWVGSQKGWFNLAYYEGGASYGQGSGYIYTSFQKTAKIWWDPWQGGAGAIYSTIDGSGSDYPIAEVDNCSRIIKYVVTLGQRFFTYSLVDMRVHDVNVVADLTKHDPTAPDPEKPVECDGSYEAAGDEAKDYGNGFADEVANDVEAYWTGWWPEVHIVAHRTDSAECHFMTHVKVDLLGTFSVVEATSDMYGLEAMSAQEQDQAEAGAVNVVERIWNDKLTVLAILVGIASLALTITTIIMANTGIWQPWAISLGAWTGFTLGLIVAIYLAFLDLGITGLDAAAKYLLIVLSLIGLVAGSLGLLWNIGGLSLSRIKAYWTQARYFKPNSEVGPKGRAASGNLLASLLLLALASCLSFALAAHG